MSAIKRILCATFFIISSGVAMADEGALSVGFSVHQATDGRTCGIPKFEVRKKQEGFYPILILQYQVVEKLPSGAIKRIGEKTEERIPLKLQKGSIKYCFDHLEENQYQVSSWYILYAGKIHTIMFDDGVGGASNELIWDASGEKVPEEIIREEDRQRESTPVKEPKPNRNINGQQKKLT